MKTALFKKIITIFVMHVHKNFLVVVAEQKFCFYSHLSLCSGIYWWHCLWTVWRLQEDAAGRFWWSVL